MRDEIRLGRRATRSVRDRGQSLVEFSLVIPIFLLIAISCVDLGRAVFAYTSVTNAAREGARLAIVNQDTTLITQRAIGQTAIAETNAPNVTISFKKPTPNADYSTNADCTPLTIGCIAIVRFQTTYRPLTPIVSNILFSGGVTMTAVSQESIEFVCPNGDVVNSANCPKQP